MNHDNTPRTPGVRVWDDPLVLEEAAAIYRRAIARAAETAPAREAS